MADNIYEGLKLENQLCFPLYACSKEIVRHYKPFLDPADLTYTQYITMMVLWEHRKMNVKEMGKYLYLDSGTLTPVLKKLEKKGYLTRERDKKDERVLIVSITPKGMRLRNKVREVPQQMGECLHFTEEEVKVLRGLLNRILDDVSKIDPDQII